jgi:tRNA-dihydrouridine synthase
MRKREGFFNLFVLGISMTSHFQYMLAPLEDFTDSAFRTLCFRHGCDLTFTEMARVSSLLVRNVSTQSRAFIPDETPTVIQLLAVKEDQLKQLMIDFTKQMDNSEIGKGFMGFNINMGCPSPEIIRVGMGCALMKRVTRAQALVKIIKDVGYLASIKMRVGMNSFEKENKAYLNLLNTVDADYFIVHGRHGKETYNNPCDFKVFNECVATGKNIIANGDIKTKEQLSELKSIGVKGVMIGRAAVTNPAIFAKLKGLHEPSIEDLKKEYQELAKLYNTKEKHVNNVLKFMGSNIFINSNK